MTLEEYCNENTQQMNTTFVCVYDKDGKCIMCGTILYLFEKYCNDLPNYKVLAVAEIDCIKNIYVEKEQDK